MLLKWIRLENIRSYTSANLHFTKGSTLLSGDIGCGKSSVLLSIEFALFGLIKGETSGSTLLRAGEAKGAVELCFEIDSREYIIRRNLRRSKSAISQESCYIIINGIKKETSPVELKAIVLSILGYPQESISQKSMLFRYTIFTPQEEMKKILFAEKEERLQILRRLFGIDKYKRIRENSEIVIKRFRDDIRTAEGFISDLEERKSLRLQAGSKLDSVEKEIKILETAEKTFLEEKEKTALKVEKLKESYKMYLQLMNEMKSLDAELMKIVSDKESNTAAIKKINLEVGSIALLPIPPEELEDRESLEADILARQKALIEKKENFAKYAERQKMLDKNISAISEKLRLNAEKIKNLKESTKGFEELAKEIQKKKDIRDRLQKLAKEVLEISAAKAGIKTKIEVSKKVSDSIKNLDECPTCLQQVSVNYKSQVIGREDKLTGELELQAKKITEQESALKRFIAENELILKQIEEKESRLANIQSNIAVMNQEKSISATLDAELAKSKDELSSLKEKLRLLDASSVKKSEESLDSDRKRMKLMDETLQKMKIIDEKKKHIKTIEDMNALLKDKVIAVNTKKLGVRDRLVPFLDIERVLKAGELSLDNANEALKRCQISIASQAATSKSLKDEILDKDIEIKKKEECKLQIAKKRQMMNWMSGSFNSIVAIIEKNVLGTVYGEFNDLFQKWFSAVMEDDIINARLDSEFTPIIQQNGFDTELDNLSGGEKTALALSYRLALNKVINDLTTEINTKDLIILDEPTDGFSEEQLDRVRDVLQLLDMEQVIIVSHESKIESYVDNIIRISKEGHESVIRS